MTKSGMLDAARRQAALEAMRHAVLFQDLDENQIDTIVRHARAARLREGDVLFEQERPAREIFLLTGGHVKLARISPDGHEKVIDLITPGNTFAEAIMFSRTPVYPVTATALVDSEVLCFEARTYLDILHQSTDACFAVMAQMSRRLHWQIGEIDRLTLHNAAFRLVNYLLEQAPSTALGSSCVCLDTPKHIIASRLSMTPETLSRTLSRLARDGLIEIQGECLLLRDVGRLRDYIRTGI
ncbi:MAG TPA: Crp/Fnr family transcriptional regulator [Gammaproteobacteria bacterium]|nr:Crp/Fnr family transcriptional regulator [Gammaproteobacteria bacterium]